MNPQMFNSFLDGTKSGIEMAADRQCHRAGAALRRARLPALRHPRPAAGAAPARGGRRAGAERAGGGDLLRGARRAAGAGRSALGRLRGVRGRDGLHPPLLQRVRRPHRSFGTLRRAVAAIPPDRAGARRVGRFCCAAAGADRGAPRLGGDVVATAKRDLAVGEVLDGEGGTVSTGSSSPRRPRWPGTPCPLVSPAEVDLVRPVVVGGHRDLGRRGPPGGAGGGAGAPGDGGGLLSLRLDRLKSEVRGPRTEVPGPKWPCRGRGRGEGDDGWPAPAGQGLWTREGVGWG